MVEVSKSFVKKIVAVPGEVATEIAENGKNAITTVMGKCGNVMEKVGNYDQGYSLAVMFGIGFVVFLNVYRGQKI